MKKISYVLLATMIFTSCFSCNKDIHMVSEAEFNKAVALEGIEYVQVDGTGKDEDIQILHEFSPNAYHCHNIWDDGYEEWYVIKIDNAHFEGVKKTSYGSQDWEEMSSEEAADEFWIPTNLGAMLKAYTDAIGFTKLKYDNETKKYSIVGQSEGHDYHMILGFERARLISYDVEIGDPANYNFTYEEKPIVPPVLYF